MTENEKVQAVEPDSTKVEEVSTVEDSKVEDSSQAGDKVTEEKTEEKGSEDDSVKTENSEDEDTDKKDDDEEPITNMGHLRKVQKESIRVKAENKTLKAENEELKKSLEENPNSEALTQKIAELEAKIQEYTDKENESSKKEALQEAGLSEDYLTLLKGTDEEWRATLEILAKNNPKNPTTRLKDDRTTNGLNGKYKSEIPSDDEISEGYKKLGRRR